MNSSSCWPTTPRAATSLAATLQRIRRGDLRARSSQWPNVPRNVQSWRRQLSRRRDGRRNAARQGRRGDVPRQGRRSRHFPIPRSRVERAGSREFESGRLREVRRRRVEPEGRRPAPTVQERRQFARPLRRRRRKRPDGRLGREAGADAELIRRVNAQLTRLGYSSIKRGRPLPPPLSQRNGLSRMSRRAVFIERIGDGEIATETEKRASAGLMKLETFLSEPGGADFVAVRAMARQFCASLNQARRTRQTFTGREGDPLVGPGRPLQRTRRAAWGTEPIAGDCLRARGRARRVAHWGLR